jgi:hypothetical protein
MFGLASSVQADIFEAQLLLRISRRICHDVGDVFGLSTLGGWVFGTAKLAADQKISLAKVVFVRCQHETAGCRSFGFVLHPSMRRFYVQLSVTYFWCLGDQLQ